MDIVLKQVTALRSPLPPLTDIIAAAGKHNGKGDEIKVASCLLPDIISAAGKQDRKHDENTQQAAITAAAGKHNGKARRETR